MSLSGGGLAVAVAGWYADPADAARVRWWDGAAWTDHVRLPEPVVEPTGIALEPALPTAPAVLALDPTVVLAAVEADPPAAPAAPAHPSAQIPESVVEAGLAPAATIPEPASPAVAPSWAAGTVTPGSHAGAAGAPMDSVAAAPAAVALLERPGGFDPEPGVVLPPVRESTLSTPSTALRPGAFAQSPPHLTAGSIGAGRSVPWVRLVLITVVLGALAAGLVLVGLPWYQTREATAAAAAVPPALAQQAPAALARQRQATVPGIPGSVAADLVARGSSWAWASAYGREANRALYLAAELPRDQWAVATRALEDPEVARELLAAVGTGLVAGAGAEASVGVAREYATPGAGRTWCREVWVAGRAGGHCLWTNGREMLQAIHLPSVETLAAKKTLVALQQLRTPAP